jgi:hypothetical protein
MFAWILALNMSALESDGRNTMQSLVVTSERLVNQMDCPEAVPFWSRMAMFVSQFVPVNIVAT